jgi:cyanophycinase
MTVPLALATVTLAAIVSAADFEYIREGNTADSSPKTRPGYALLGGGGDVDEAFRFMIERSGGGDFLVLRARGTGAYNPYVRRLGTVNSAATLILNNREASSNPEVLDKVRRAEAIFFAGGDQWNYISRWQNTPLQKAIQERINAGVPVGGTSAGLAILGQYLFSAEFDTVQTPQALADPYDKRVAIGCCFVQIPHLENLITDSHFSARNRMGRLLVFLARMQQDSKAERPRGVGIDEATAVLLEATGAASVVGKGSAFFVRLSGKGKPEQCVPGKALTASGFEVHQVDAKSGPLNIKNWKFSGGSKSQLKVKQGSLEP